MITPPPHTNPPPLIHNKTFLIRLRRLLKLYPPDSLEAQYRWGGIDYAVLTSSTSKSMMVPFITVRTNGPFQSGFGLMLDPLIQNLSLLSQTIQTDPGKYSEIHSSGAKYVLNIISPIPSPDGDPNSIELHFNGAVVDAKVCRKGKKWERDDRDDGQYKRLID